MKLTDINEIKSLLGRHGFRFSKSLGQNFLIDASVPFRIAEYAELDRNVGVLEIGAGVGCLTEQLALRAGKVLCVEFDQNLKPVLAETLSGYDNIEIVFGDIMKQDISKLVAEKLSGFRPVVCANLPYNITTPVLTSLLQARCFESINVMIQKEVAQRICAKENTPEYGAFGIFVNWYAVPEKLFDVSPSCFIPQPKVTSSVIRLVKREAPPVEVMDETSLFRVIRAAFNQRRKTLVNALSSQIAGISKQRCEEILINCGLSEKIRGEALTIEQFAQISDAICTLNNADL